jgi:hypothetical protein
MQADADHATKYRGFGFLPHCFNHARNCGDRLETDPLRISAHA